MATQLANMWDSRLKGPVPAATVDEKLDSFTIKMPAGTKEAIKQQAQMLKIPYRDMVRSIFEHGLAYSTSKAKKVEQAENKPDDPNG